MLEYGLDMLARSSASYRNSTFSPDQTTQSLWQEPTISSTNDLTGQVTQSDDNGGCLTQITALQRTFL